MGNILTFVKQISNIGLPELDKKYEVFLDFENDALDLSELSEEERKLSEDVETKLKTAIENLTKLRNYGSGGRNIIKEASASPSDKDAQDSAWRQMLPLVDSLLTLKKTADDLTAEVPRILTAMWNRKDGRESGDLVNVFKKNMFLVVQLGEILDFAMRFDALKQCAPSIANDIRLLI